MTEKKTRRVKPADETTTPNPAPAEAQGPDAKDELEGIEFADEKPQVAKVDEAAPQMEGGDPANQQAARQAIERMRQLGDRPAQAAPAVVPLDEKAAAKLAPKAFRVVAPATIAKGAANYTLRPGKIVTANEYDLEALRQAGVQLEEVR